MIVGQYYEVTSTPIIKSTKKGNAKQIIFYNN